MNHAPFMSTRTARLLIAAGIALSLAASHATTPPTSADDAASDAPTADDTMLELRPRQPFQNLARDGRAAAPAPRGVIPQPNAGRPVAVGARSARPASDAERRAWTTFAPVSAARVAKTLDGSAGTPAKAGADALATDGTLAIPASLAQIETTCEQIALSAGSDVEGTLGGDDCRWGQVTGAAVPSYVDQYRLSAPERSRLTFTVLGEFAPYVSIHDTGYRWIADAYSSDGPANLEVTLPAGDYILLLSPLSDEEGLGGGYTLSAEVAPSSPPGGCGSAPLDVPGSTTGMLTADGCRIFDYLPGDLLDLPTTEYTFALDRPGMLTLELTSAEIDPRYILLDERGAVAENILDDADAGDTGRSTLTTPLSDGTYRLLVVAAGNGMGSFSVDAAFEPAGDSCTVGEIGLDDSVAGSFGTDDCLDVYFSDALEFGDPVDRYAVYVPQDGQLRVDVESELDTLLYLMDEQDRLFQEQGFTPPATFEAPPGAYRLAVQSVSEGPGTYTLTTEFEPLDAECSVASIGRDARIEGTLEADDCKLTSFWFRGVTDPVDPYRIEIPERGQLDIALDSEDFDAFLIVVGGPYPDVEGLITPMLIQRDDVSGDNTNAHTSLTLPPGEYLILATNFAGQGAYSLQTSFTPRAAPDTCTVTDLEPGQSLDATLTGDDCHVFDIDPSRLSASPVDRYRIGAPERGTLAILATSESFFPRMQLRDADTGRILITDYDPDFLTLSAALGFFTDAREYIVDVETATDDDLIGDYRLNVTFTAAAPPGEDCRVVDVAPNSQTEGALGGEDCLWQEVPGGPGTPAAGTFPVDVYRTTAAQIGAMTTTLTSGTFTPALGLFDDRFGEYGFSLPGTLGLPAEIRLSVAPPGDYHAHVISQDTAAGDYTLEWTFAPDAFDPDELPTSTPTATPTPPGPFPTDTPEETPTAEPSGGTVYVPYARRGDG